MNEQLKQRIDEIKEHCNATCGNSIGGHADTCKALMAAIEDLETIENVEMKFVANRTLQRIANAWDGETQRTDGGCTPIVPDETIKAWSGDRID